ncbi:MULTISPECIES: 50S ribosomal protein L22 [Kiloniella]|uniref:Large ribosomal subunit protein uL22 n=2 Tax=Kiloniella TaxID=454159 RepID=A0A0M2R6W5_9PROT|nr:MULTISPECIES: 50S ribosomal protein L22 [Kiloniella]KKJ75263.1 50S ribosomal protein L22 [Kiloniella litopenaei]KLN61251.1 50S ribosomal protein L22 [Kiloniella spongiae]
MSKSKRDRALADNEARAIAVNLRTSPRKLNLVAASIRGKSAESALAELTFSKRRIAIEVKKALQSAIANAENNHQLDVDRLFVSEAFVGKSFVMKRFRARARGRVGRLLKPWSQLTVVVREREETA